VFDPWPDEPDESSPETRWGNPERDLPRIPEVSTDESDVDPHTLETFWVSVIFANAALFGVSLGAMLWYFRGQALLGGALVLVGVLAGLRTYASYRAFGADDGESGAASTDGGGDPDSTDSDGGDTPPEADGRRAPAETADADAGPGPESGLASDDEPETETEAETERNR
jgi:hypothetical protein